MSKTNEKSVSLKSVFMFLAAIFLGYMVGRSQVYKEAIDRGLGDYHDRTFLWDAEKVKK